MILSLQHDPMGQAVLDYLEHGKAAPIKVHSSLFEDDEIPVGHLFRSPSEMPLLERAALTYAHGRVLDVGAGAGCHTLALQNQGVEVTAVDVSPGCVTAMRRRGVRDARLADFLTDDVGQHYDTILLLMNGLGICGGLNELPVFFARLNQLLPAVASVIPDACDLSYIYEDEAGRIDLTDVEGYYGEVDYRMSYEKVEGKPFNWLYVDFDTLATEAQRYGYTAERLCDDPDSTAYLARMVSSR